MAVDIIAIDENTWRIENEFVRFFLLAGEQNALLIDSGATCPEARELAESLTELPVELLNTHGDPDHVSGNGAFSRFYMDERDYVNCKLAERFPSSSCIPLHDGDIIDLGGRKLEILSIPGHTAGSVAVLDVQARILYPGDSVQSGHIFLFGAHRVPGCFAAGLEKLSAAQDRFDALRPAHGDAQLPADYIEKVLHSWKSVCAGGEVPQRIELHGRPVDSFTTQFCGFFCEPAASL